MKAKLYHFLVNRQPGIKRRYHHFHDNAHGIKKIISWGYLLWLNFAYYVLCCRFLGRVSETAIYEEKKLEYKKSESELAKEKIGSVEAFCARLADYDVISFDIFDTLIFRPFSEPTDLFHFIGEQLDFMNFKEVRHKVEKKVRELCLAKHVHTEVTLQEIWEQMEKETGIPAVEGMRVEVELEKQFCYANPFMAEVFWRLQAQGKKLIVVSDMYLPKTVLHEILQAGGYSGYTKLYVSCEYRKNKAAGGLYEVVRRENPGRLIHVGDNLYSDVSMAEKCGIVSCHYPNVNARGEQFRPQDMSPIIGGAYRGLVNNYLYHGGVSLGMEEEYGFIYGGLFVTGYCAFIHEYCKKNQIDKILFLSRDGDILKQAYEILYPDEQTVYAYWSRRAATKLMASEDKYDYFRRFLYHKVNQGISTEKILESMELSALMDRLPEGLEKSSILTDKTVDSVRAFLEEHWIEVLETYREEQTAAKAYYSKLLSGCERVAAVDIGWAGSGAIALNHMVQKVWQLSCEVIGLIAGTNTIHNAEPEASEAFLQSGRLVSYLYSQSFNRDLMKKHDPNKNYNVYWELLLSSPTQQFRGFALNEVGEVRLVFGKYDANVEEIRKVQKGILAFIREYKAHFGAFPFMYYISGRDAYAPMLVAAGNKERYLKEIAKKFELEINVG